MSETVERGTMPKNGNAREQLEFEYKRIREKYSGYALTDFVVAEILRAEKENLICENCEGLPCKLKNSNGSKRVVRIDEKTNSVFVPSYDCQYVLAERQRKKIEKNFRLAKIPAKYGGATFADYLIDETNADAVKTAKDFAKNANKSLLLYGLPGRGKTMLAAIIANEFVKAEKSVVFEDVPSLLDDLQSSFGEKSSVSLEEKMLSLSEADLLVLDDLGTEKPTEWAVTRLYMIINERYNSQKPVLVTSNYKSGELAERLNKPRDAKVEGVTGNRIVSRLVEMCDIVKFGGADRRLKR